MFGNLSLKPEGCINYMYLKDLLEKYTTLKSDNTPTKSRYEDVELSDGAMEAIKRVDLDEKDFIKIKLSGDPI